MLAKELNLFFIRFEAERSHSAPPTSWPSDNHLLELQEYQARGVLKAVNPHKAPGPDGVLGKVLRACADQLSGVLMRIINTSLKQATVPPCLKAAPIISVPIKPTISSLNDYRPVALTSVVMKCFERLVLHHLMSNLPENFDQHQFAYKANRSTADAVATVLHAAVSHTEKQGSYVRMLFVEKSRVKKLTDLDFPPITCAWINSFLTDRPQTLKVQPHTSSTRITSCRTPVKPRSW